jgi:hypothetical protein
MKLYPLFPYIPSLCSFPSHWYHPLYRTYFIFLSFIVLKTFLFVIVMHRVSFRNFLIYMNLPRNYFICSIFLPFTLALFQWWIQQVWMFHIHTCIPYSQLTFGKLCNSSKVYGRFLTFPKKFIGIQKGFHSIPNKTN